MNKVGMTVLGILLMVSALAVLLVFWFRLRKRKYREMNCKIAVFAGKLVNKAAEGTLGYGILFEEGMSDNTLVVHPGQKGAGQASCCITLWDVQANHSMQVQFRDTLTIGRSGQPQGVSYLVIPHPDVSRRHCRFYTAAGQIYVEDLGSKNHTYINGVQVQQVLPVQTGDRIAFGRSEYKITY